MVCAQANPAISMFCNAVGYRTLSFQAPAVKNRLDGRSTGDRARRPASATTWPDGVRTARTGSLGGDSQERSAPTSSRLCGFRRNPGAPGDGRRRSPPASALLAVFSGDRREPVVHLDPEALGSAVKENRLPILEIAGRARVTRRPSSSIVDGEGHDRLRRTGCTTTMYGCSSTMSLMTSTLPEYGDRVDALPVLDRGADDADSGGIRRQIAPPSLDQRENRSLCDDVSPVGRQPAGSISPWANRNQ